MRSSFIITMLVVSCAHVQPPTVDMVKLDDCTKVIRGLEQRYEQPTQVVEPHLGVYKTGLFQTPNLPKTLLASSGISLLGPGATSGGPTFDPIIVPTNSCVILDGSATCGTSGAHRWTWDGTDVKLMAGGSTFLACNNSTGVCTDNFGFATTATVSAATVALTSSITGNPAIAAGTITLATNTNLIGGTNSKILLGSAGQIAADGSHLSISQTAPTISSGFGTSPNIVASNGSLAFEVNVGTGGTASSGVIGLPTATTGWNCQCTDITTNSATVFITKQTASSTTSCTVGNFNTSAAAAAWAASDKLRCIAAAY